MGSIPFAFSVHHFVNSVGADAGFAAIIGLAILILLYFAQARETASLRRGAWDSAERIQRLEGEVAALAQSRAPLDEAPAGVPVQAAVAAAGAGAIAASRGRMPQHAGTRIPVAPAGVGAPALTAATKLIPTPELGAVALAPGPVPDATTIGAPATVAAAAAGIAAGRSAGSNGSGHPPVAAPEPVAAASPAQAPPRGQIRPGGATPPAGRRPVPLPATDQNGGGPPRWLLGILVAVIAIVIVVVVVVVTSGGSPSKGSNASASTGNTAARRHVARRTPAVNPSTVTVSVLNGTAIAGLAHTVAQGLGTAGYKLGVTTNATDQTHTTTIVAYLPGFKQDAAAVAKSLKVSPNTVQPVDQPTQQIACQNPGPCSVNVIVTVGSDLSNRK
jgi:hypothetical protein